MKDIVGLARKMAEQFASTLGLEIEEVEWVKEQGNNILRIIADSKEGLTIDDAQALNKAMSQALDEKDFIDCEYLLEVSSPGLEKELKNDEQISKAVNQYVNVKLYAALEGKKEFEGTLLKFVNNTISLEVKDKVLEIEKNKISKIRKAIKF